MAALSSLRVVVPQIDLTRAQTASSVVGEKAFFGVRSAKHLLGSFVGEKACRVSVANNVRATAAASKVVKEKPKSSDKSQLVSGFTQFD